MNDMSELFYFDSDCIPFRGRASRARVGHPGPEKTSALTRRYIGSVVDNPSPPISLRRNRDEKRNSPSHCRPNRGTKDLELLPEEFDGSCSRQVKIVGRAITVIRLLEGDLGISPVRKLPNSTSCRTFRSDVRQCFGDLPAVAELSVKTAQKVIETYCKECSKSLEGLSDRWKEERLCAQVADPLHLEEFRRVFRRNVEDNWNRHSYPFVPNGSSSYGHLRSEGGNWNLEGFSRKARVIPVISAGKPRIVTAFSSYNSRILTPLHKSLYATITGKGWCLRGPPKDSDIRWLSGPEGCKCHGDYVSVDYVSATDKINLVYTRVMIQELISKAPSLTSEERRCLEAVGHLDFGSGCSSSGQPMGSLMSFPLLCLLNKTMVDMALLDLLRARKIGFREWSSHRCLVNGDDLLYKEIRENQSLVRTRLAYHVRMVGMLMNDEKTMQSPSLAEINSTVFEDGRELPKTNVKALYMASDEGDVLGYALRSTRTAWAFRRVVRDNARLLARQEVKTLVGFPMWVKAVCRKDRKIRKALLTNAKKSVDPVRNFFNVVDRPEGYDLSKEEETRVINERVAVVRPLVLEELSRRKERTAKKVRVVEYSEERTWKSLLRPIPNLAEEKVLQCLAKEWETKKRAQLVEEENVEFLLRGETCEVSHLADVPRPAVFRLVEAIRCWKTESFIRLRKFQTKTPGDTPSTQVYCGNRDEPFSDGWPVIPL